MAENIDVTKGYDQVKVMGLKEMFEKLAAPFPAEDIEWRAAVTNAEKNSGLALAYLTARAVMDRLDEVVGPENWTDSYHPGPDGGVVCILSLKINGEWISKEDGAENTDFEEVKGGLSSALKRAGVKWGIGRYLYKLESKWCPCVAHGKVIEFTPTPKLPAWALPNSKSEKKQKAEEEPEGPKVYPKTSKGLASYAMDIYQMDGKAVGKLLSEHGATKFEEADWEKYLELLKEYHLGWVEAQKRAEELTASKEE
jgi:hypothetical protein